MIYGALSQDLCPQPRRLVYYTWKEAAALGGVWKKKVKKQPEPRSHKAKEAKSFMQKSSAFFIQ